MEDATAAPATPPKQARRAAWGALAGTAIEWYDFYVYGTAAALVLGHLFFPKGDEFVSSLSALATFAIGFLLRPLGAIIFGHIGDRVSRKTSLLITILMMGGSTVAIGLLPTYATVGALAPALLLVARMIQGLSVGGEWGGAVLIAEEGAPKHRKALAASMAQVGAPIGSILSTLVFLALSDQDFLMRGGWRIPFLLSGTLLVVGLLIRLKLEENSEFVAARKKVENAKEAVPTPLLESIRHFPLTNICVFLACIAVSGAYMRNVFALNWSTTSQGVEKNVFLGALLTGSILQIILTPTAAILADRFGVRRAQIAFTCVYIVVAPLPLFALVSTGTMTGVYLGVMLAYVGHSVYYATLSGFLATLFPTELRFTGISLGYQLAGSLVSAFVPLAATFLAGRGGENILPVQGLYAVIIVVTLAGVILAPRVSARERQRYNESLAVSVARENPGPEPTGRGRVG